MDINRVELTSGIISHVLEKRKRGGDVQKQVETPTASKGLERTSSEVLA